MCLLPGEMGQRVWYPLKRPKETWRQLLPFSAPFTTRAVLTRPDASRENCMTNNRVSGTVEVLIDISNLGRPLTSDEGT